MPSSEKRFLHWLTGVFDVRLRLIIDRKVLGRGGMGVSFSLRLDRPTLLKIQGTLSFGKVYPRVDPGATAPSKWVGRSIRDCKSLVDFLGPDTYFCLRRPVRVARYRVWAQIVNKLYEVATQQAEPTYFGDLIQDWDAVNS